MDINVKIDSNIFNGIKKLASEKNTTEEAFINKSLEKIIKEHDCEKFHKGIDKIHEKMDGGNYIELDVDKLEERYKFQD
ncbi:hypothetical protein MBCUT_10580 [Methanobrevibacter cuticularis]|uniref:Uncharacterized protein n=1 Tax=Methanobrevibacter cuticularis TaxID=47311 RepID=A0A166E215_9EURY|nr:hypothetical protein [Methanobrevibacter cuticularis]KZX16192.1 hypothetical protein MBCUT_10580 [Methanobrevibacter cuticularis]